MNQIHIGPANVYQIERPETGIAIGYNAGHVQIGRHAGYTPSGNYAYYEHPIKYVKYVVRFRKPLNLIDLYGRICSKTKNIDIVTMLYHKWFSTYPNTFITDNVLLLNIQVYERYTGEWPDFYNQTSAYDITTEINKFKENVTNANHVADWVAKKDGNWFSAWLEQMNTRKIPLLEEVMNVVREFANEYIDEEAIKDAMSPAAVATALAAADNDDDNMLDRLETFAAECDAATSPIISHGWVIE